MKKSLIIILSYYFIQGVIHNFGHPVTPTYVNMLGIPQYMFGFFFAAMSLGLLVGAPIWGILGDEKAKKPFIVIGLLIYSLGQVLFVSTNNVFLMTFYRFLSGFGVSASVTLLLSHLIGLVPKESRTKYLSISAALIALGTTIGYQIGGYMGTYFIREVFFIQGAINAAYVLFIVLTLKEVKHTKTETHQNFVQSFKNATQLSPSLLMFLLGLTFATIAATNLNKYLDVYIIDLGYSTRQLGTFVMVTGIVGLFTNFVIVPWIARFKKDLVIMEIIQILSAIIVFMVFRSHDIMRILYSLFMIYIILKSMFQPLEQNYISLNADGEKYGTIMGVRQAFFSIGMVLGPLIAGFIYERNPILVFDFSAVMFILAFVLIKLSQNALKKSLDIKQESDVLLGHLETSDYKASP